MLKLLSFLEEDDDLNKKKGRSNKKKDEPKKKFAVYKTTLMRWAGIKSVKVLDRYIETLSSWFNIEEAIEGKLHIDLKDESSEVQYVQSIKCIIHKIQVFCRKYKIKYTADAFKDAIQVIIQYYNRGINVVLSMVFQSCFIKHTLEPALINHRIKKKLEELKKLRKLEKRAAQSENAVSEKVPEKAPEEVKQKKCSKPVNLFYKEGRDTFNNFKNREYSREVYEQILNKNRVNKGL